MDNPAIFIIDMLNDCFGHERLAQRRNSLCNSINQLTTFARSRQIPVVWVRQEFEPDLSDAFLDQRRENIKMFIKGTLGPQILAELSREKSDSEVLKKRYSMFFQTNIEELLSKNQIRTLVLSGVNTHACVRMAAIDGYQRDYEVIIIRDCVDSKDQQHHEITMDYLDGGVAKVMSLQEFKNSFGKAV